MELNLINPELSDIKYKITKFPDGEAHFFFCDPVLDMKGVIDVKCRITNAEELFIILQVGDVLDRYEFEWNLWISYLMSMRMDRVMDYGRPHSLKIVCNMLKSMNYRKIGVVEAHSDKTRTFLRDGRYIPGPFVHKLISEISDPSKCCLVLPDAGAAERYSSYTSWFGTVVFNKNRNLETGEFLGFEIVKINNRFNSDTFIFVDDLCDAGGTFLAELEMLKEKFPEGKFGIIICHAVNPIGLTNLSREFDFVITTDSYKNWDQSLLPNLVVREIWPDKFKNRMKCEKLLRN